MDSQKAPASKIDTWTGNAHIYTSDRELKPVVRRLRRGLFMAGGVISILAVSNLALVVTVFLQ